MDIDVDELMQLQSFHMSLEDDSFFLEAPYSEEFNAETETEEINTGKKYSMLKIEQRKQVVIDLFALADDTLNLRRGVMKEIAQKYKVSRFTIGRLWKEALRQKRNGEQVVIKSNKVNCGRRSIHITDDTLKFVPLHKRTTMRSFAKALDVSVSTVHRLAQKGLIRSHSNSIKPSLTEKHKKDRMIFILRFIIPATVGQKPRFDMLINMIHIDEKWFFMTRTTQRFYLLTEEEDPYRSCQSKGFITKVMFLGALARPRFDPNGELIWDGKIGIFPFTEEVAAQRGSINRPRGTVETKPIQFINKDTIRVMVLQTLLPKIREMWPVGACKQIWIQQDNARPHIKPDDPAFVEASTVDGFDMRLIQQPAQSPDLNILDLGFFRAIQSIQHQAFPDTVSKLILSVKEAYRIYNPIDINYTWLSLMKVMDEVLKVKGGNNYKLPHRGKRSQAAVNNLSETVEVDEELLNEINYDLSSNVI